LPHQPEDCELGDFAANKTHHPFGLILPATSWQEEGGTKWAQIAQCCAPLG
jgi:hypothetical protein